MKNLPSVELLKDAKSIRRALMEVRAKKIAVAYVGEAWKQFLPAGCLQEIVLSPTFGSNPKAIEALMKELGPKNVHFLDNLHAKFYIGDRQAVVGSNNLSANGFSDNGLRETAVLLQNENVRTGLLHTFDGYKIAAKAAYPTHAAKLLQLRKLKRQWDIGCWHGLAGGVGKSPPLSDYHSGLDRIHIAWYGAENMEFDQKEIHAAIPASSNSSLDEFFEDTLAFLEEDDVQVGDWILQWRCKNNGMPVSNGRVDWMQVHYVVPHGFKDERDGYTKLVAEANPDVLRRSAPPFRLGKPMEGLIRDLLASQRFPELLSLDDETWRLAPADRVTDRFISRLRELSQPKR